MGNKLLPSQCYFHWSASTVFIVQKSIPLNAPGWSGRAWWVGRIRGPSASQKTYVLILVENIILLYLHWLLGLHGALKRNAPEASWLSLVVSTAVSTAACAPRKAAGQSLQRNRRELFRKCFKEGCFAECLFEILHIALLITCNTFLKYWFTIFTWPPILKPELQTAYNKSYHTKSKNKNSKTRNRKKWHHHQPPHCDKSLFSKPQIPPLPISGGKATFQKGGEGLRIPRGEGIPQGRGHVKI